MKFREFSFWAGVCLSAGSWLPMERMSGQTATSATILGTITDSSESVVVGAKISFAESSTSLRRAVLTNEAGQYTFVSVPPGLYRVTVSKAGFREAVVEDLRIDVAKSYLVDVRLKVGELAQTVRAEAGLGAELQTLDSTVGVTLKGEAMRALPAINRSAAALLALQPLVVSSRAMNKSASDHAVAGSRADQNTFLLDGADASDLTSGSGSYFPTA